MHLRKQDQEENFTRSKNFHELYKLKLVEKILEKQDRADMIKKEQTRISNACALSTTRKADRNFMTTAVISGAGGKEDTKLMAKTT
jgi:hypothetical protein